MNIVCITGINGDDLRHVAAILEAAGLRLARPAQSVDGLSIATWHERIIASTGPGVPVEAPGYFYERLAGDIFVANLDAPVWGWADAHSVRLLDFWGAFHPGMRFVLVTQSLRQLLAGQLVAEDGCGSLDAVMDEWENTQDILLRFYHDHKEHALFVDLEACLSSPEAFVSLCAQKWHLPLTSPTAAPENTSEATAPPSLALLLADVILNDNPRLSVLSEEVTATLDLRCDDLVPLQQQLTTTDDILKAFLEIRNQCGEIGSVSAVRDRLEQLTWERKTCTEQIQMLQHQFVVLTADTNAKLEQAQAALEAVHQEKAMLLVQLAQVRETLDENFAHYRRADNECRRLDARWKRLLQRYPGYCDYETYALVPTLRQTDAFLSWHITNLEAAGRFLPMIAGSLTVNDAAVVLSVARGTGASPLVRWPVGGDGQVTSIAFPCGQAGDPVFALGTSDWQFIQVLAGLLQGLAAISGQDTQGVFVAGLGQFLAQASALPPVFRYDSVQLQSEQVHPAYEHLWLRFENLSFGSIACPAFEFRFSCAEIGAEAFGRKPKLEFPESVGQDPFESWFRESEDHFGHKLELRFALPGDMDLMVWEQLSEGDRYFITVLVANLPAILHALHDSGVKTNHSLADWAGMARTVAQILERRRLEGN